IPARYALERGDWKDAAALPAVSTKRLLGGSLIRFTRGVCMARSGDVACAQRGGEAIPGIQEGLFKAKDAAWAARAEEQVAGGSAFRRVTRTGHETHAFGCGWRRRKRQARGDGEPSLSDAGVVC